MSLFSVALFSFCFLSLVGAFKIKDEHFLADTTVLLQSVASAQEEATMDQADDSGDDIHVTFVLDCRPFNLWQHEMLFNSARLVGQRGPITAIISGCADKEKARLQERHAGLNLPAQYTQYFVELFNDEKSIWLSKPFGFQQWYNTSGPKRDVVALLDPDFVFVTPLTAKLNTSVLPLEWKGTVPSRVQKGVVVAQRYNTFPPLGDSEHFRLWGFTDGVPEGVNMTGDDFLTWVCSGNPNGESGCRGLTNYELGTFHASGVPYIAHRDDWDWLATEWTTITERLQKYAPRGYFVDMYSWSLANAHKGGRQFIQPSLMLSDYRLPDTLEYWAGVDGLAGSNVDVCQDGLEEILPKVRHQIPSFIHYCQTVRAPWDSFKIQDNGALFSKYWFDWGLESGEPHMLERCEQTERSPLVGPFPALRWIKSAAPRLNESMTTVERRARFLGCVVKAFLRSAVQAACPGQPLAKDVLEERDMDDIAKRIPVMDLMMSPLVQALRRHPDYSGQYLVKDEYLGEISIGDPQGNGKNVIMRVTKDSSGSPTLQTVAEELVSWNISQEEASKIFEDATGAHARSNAIMQSPGP